MDTPPGEPEKPEEKPKHRGPQIDPSRLPPPKPFRPNIMAIGCGLLVVGVVLAIAIPGYFGGHCIVKGTLIDTPSGSRPIEDLREGDEVWGRAADGTWRVGRILRTIPARSFGSLRIRFTDQGVLCATEAHPVAVPGGWLAAGQIAPGMKVVGRVGERTVDSIERSAAWVRVYDLEVSPDSNFVAGGVLVHNKSGAERYASTSLKTIASAETDFRSNDRDGNLKNDFWVGDVAGLYAVKGPDGEPIKIIELSVAAADVAPLTDISKYSLSAPKGGYHFAVIPLQADGTPYDDGSHFNSSAFAFCAFPEHYRKDGIYTLIVNENNTIFRSNIDKPHRIKKWPTDEELLRDWHKLD